MLKKKIAAITSMVLMAGLLGACNPGPDAGQDTEGTGAAGSAGNSSQSSPDGEGKEVTVVTYWNESSGEKAFQEEIVELFNSTIGKENHVKIEMEHVESGDYDQQLAVAFQNGVQPDIVYVRSTNLAEYAEKGYLASLDEVPGIEETVKNSNATQVIGENAWRGKMYMLPQGARTIGLAYNKDLFQAAGIVDENGEARPPVTLAEMVEDARLLTDVGKQQFGFCAPLGWGPAFVQYYIALPSQSSSGMVNGYYNYQTGAYDFEGVRPMAEALLQMKADGSIYPGAEGLDNDPARARFAEGAIGMMMTAQWDCAVWNDQFPAKCDWGVVPIPVENAEDAYVQYCGSSYSYAIAAKGLSEGRGEAIGLVFAYLHGEDMTIRRCEAGMEIPWNSDVVAKCDFSNSPKGWDDFCNVRKASSMVNYAVKGYDLDGLDSFETEFLNKVWSGEESLDWWVEEMTKRYNEATGRYMENNPGEVADAMAGRQDPSLDLHR